MSDQLVAEKSTWQHTTLTIEIHVTDGMRPHKSAGERPQIYALDRATNGTGKDLITHA